MASTNVRLIGNAPWLPPVTSKRNASRAAGWMEKNSERTGQPVTMAFFPGPCRNFIAGGNARGNSRQQLVVRPGSAFGSNIMLGRGQPGGQQHWASRVAADAKRSDGSVLAEHASRIEHRRDEHR